MVKRLHELGREGKSFAFETTLASRTFAPWLKGLIAAGYDFHLVFLWLPTPELAVARVADRVRSGGHSVPEETIRRRYRAGLKNFFRLYRPMTTSWSVYDNSRTDRARPVAAGAGQQEARVQQRKIWERIKGEYDHE